MIQTETDPLNQHSRNAGEDLSRHPSISSETKVNSIEANDLSDNEDLPARAEPPYIGGTEGQNGKRPPSECRQDEDPVGSPKAVAKKETGPSHQVGTQGAVLLQALWRSDTYQHFLGTKSPDGGFRNRPAASAAVAADVAAALSDSGIDTYFACAEFKDSTSRTAANAVQAWAFWLDIDCAEDKAETGKGYASIALAAEALDEFCTLTALPAPTHRVVSGSGLHVYWTIDCAIEPDAWISCAKRLKDLAAKHGFMADPSRTADIASVLRVPGTYNHKYSPPRPVTLELATLPIERDPFLQSIDKAYELARAPEVDDAPGKPAHEPIETGSPDLGKLAGALMVLDPDCDDETWKLRRLAPLARAARAHPELAEIMRALARTWSSGELRKKPSLKWRSASSASGESGEQVFDATWQRFCDSSYSGQPVTLGTIYHDAHLAGWRDAHGVTSDSADRQAADSALLEAMYLAVVKDAWVPLEGEYVAVLARLFDTDRASYQRVREKLKALNKAVSLSALDTAVKEYISRHLHPQTHHGYAKDLLNSLAVDGYAPVQYEDGLYCLDAFSSLWVVKRQVAIERLVAERHDGNAHCNRGADYKAIALHAMTLADDPSYFDAAPVGLACPDGFYSVEDVHLVVEPLTPNHRQRVRVAFSPKPMPTPLFDEFLHETFKSPVAGEEEQQVRLVQEIAGSITLGIAHRFQKAFLFYDKIGRAGKGTLMDIVKQLVPATVTSAVSPFRWDHDYFLMQLVGKRLNVVGELPEEKVLPAAHFKTVIGGDSLTGRFPYGRPFTFRNAAGHVFMTNHLITSKDHSEALFARWILVEFPNSILLTGKKPDPQLATRIVASEMSGIAHWALQGGIRVLANGGYSSSIVHDRLMEAWRRGNNSVQEFIHEDCTLNPDGYVRRSVFYRAYTAWCADNGRKAFSKSAVKDFLMANLLLGIRFAVLDGHEVFRGVDLKTGTFVPDAARGYGHSYQPSHH